jgi:hypothetical protein
MLSQLVLSTIMLVFLVNPDLLHLFWAISLNKEKSVTVMHGVTSKKDIQMLNQIQGLLHSLKTTQYKLLNNSN